MGAGSTGRVVSRPGTTSYDGGWCHEHCVRAIYSIEAIEVEPDVGVHRNRVDSFTRHDDFFEVAGEVFSLQFYLAQMPLPISVVRLEERRGTALQIEDARCWPGEGGGPPEQVL